MSLAPNGVHKLTADAVDEEAPTTSSTRQTCFRSRSRACCRVHRSRVRRAAAAEKDNPIDLKASLAIVVASEYKYGVRASHASRFSSCSSLSEASSCLPSSAAQDEALDRPVTELMHKLRLSGIAHNKPPGSGKIC